MSEITCPFKYPKYTYCDCKWPGKDTGIEYSGEFKSLEKAWIDHIVELSDHRKKEELKKINETLSEEE